MEERVSYKDFMRSGLAAEYLGVTPRTLREWSDSGRISTYKDDANQRLYKKEDLDDFLGKIKIENEKE